MYFFTKSSIFAIFVEEKIQKGQQATWLLGTYSLFMPALNALPWIFKLRQCPRPGVLYDAENAFPQNAYLPNVDNTLKLFLLHVSWLFFMIEKVLSNVNRTFVPRVV